MNTFFDLNKPAPTALQIQAQIQKEESAKLKKLALVGVVGVVLLCAGGTALSAWYEHGAITSLLMMLLVGYGGVLLLLAALSGGAVLLGRYTFTELTDATPEEIDDLVGRDLPDCASNYVRSVAEQGRVITGGEYALLVLAAARTHTSDCRQEAMDRLLDKLS